MSRKIKIFGLLVVIVLSAGCDRRGNTGFSSMESLLGTYSKKPSVEFNKFPPRLVKAFLKFEKSKNEGLIEMLEMSKLFIVVHVDKKNKETCYDTILEDVTKYMKAKEYERIEEIKIEQVNFREHYCIYDDDIKEIVLEIDEPGLYSIYCLKGNFSRADIIRISKKVSPVEFLRLNRILSKK